MKQDYDYIIIGAGCAGLSLLTRLIKSGQSKGKKILLLDKAPKDQNDRTWCFWEKENGLFQDIVYRQWPQLDFYSPTYKSTLDISPYHYKLIRGIDFYNYCFNIIQAEDNIDIVYGAVTRAWGHKDAVTIDIDGHSHNFPRAIAFNSIPAAPVTTSKSIHLLQHFKGWIIETEQAVFDPAKATLMDFRISQEHGAAFVYVLPFSTRQALVEYTLFTPKLLEQSEYDSGLESYISDKLKPGAYKVIEQEFGVIPMTNQEFPFYKDGVYHIGTAGGQTKASSGYTFQFIQKQTRAIVEQLQSGQSLSHLKNTPKRFHFYDHTLLYILYHQKYPGNLIFTELFKRNKPQDVLRFLDNETSLKQEWKIISSLPTWPFLKAALRVL